MNAETFEFEQSIVPNMPPMTKDNIRELGRRELDKVNYLYNKYVNGGSSPKNTYLQIASKYTDVDYINTAVSGINE